MSEKRGQCLVYTSITRAELARLHRMESERDQALQRAEASEKVVGTYEKSLVDIRVKLGLSEHDDHEIVVGRIDSLRQQAETARADGNRAFDESLRMVGTIARLETQLQEAERALAAMTADRDAWQDADDEDCPNARAARKLQEAEKVIDAFQGWATRRPNPEGGCTYGYDEAEEAEIRQALETYKKTKESDSRSPQPKEETEWPD